MDIHHELITPELRTTSRVVAEKFGKRHDNVLRDIERIIVDAPDDFGRLNFEETSYIDRWNREQRQVKMTRDGFVLLAMGFTGAAAMEWKVRFIEAFNMMEAELAARIAADLPATPSQPRLADELTSREKITMVRETRLLHGIAAGRRMWAMLDLPNVTDRPAGLLGDPADARACLSCLMAMEIGGRAVGAWVADAMDSPALNREGLRVRPDGLFVSNMATVFAGSRWAGGAHRVALMSLDGVHPAPTSLTLAGRGQRGLIVPLSAIAALA